MKRINILTIFEDLMNIISMSKGIQMNTDSEGDVTKWDTFIEYDEAFDLNNELIRLNMNNLTNEDYQFVQKSITLEFAEWLDIVGIRHNQNQWQYKGNNYEVVYTTSDMFHLFMAQKDNMCCPKCGKVCSCDIEYMMHQTFGCHIKYQK